MVTITKEGSENYPDIRIYDGKRSFLIKREYAPDPYWIPDFHPLNDNDDITFEINKNDGEVYKLFEMLHRNIITGNILPLDETNIKNKSEDEIKIFKREKAKQRKSYQRLAQNTGLVKNDIITWHSEDLDPFESSAVLTIKKCEDKILIIFSKSKKHEEFSNNFPTYAIRISESWSRYQSFFSIFVRLHRQLQSLEYDKNKFTSDHISECQESTPSKRKIKYRSS